MPIRTNRGRTAVYRRLWGWPLRSPRHLITAIIALVVLAVVAALAVNNGIHRTAANAATGGSSVVTTPSTGPGPSAVVPPVTTPPQTRLSTPPETPQEVAPSSAALSVIQAWARAWVNHPVGMTNQQWLAQLQPYTSPELLPQMSSVELTNIQATQVTGLPVVVHSYPSSVEVTLGTNGGTLDITAINTGTAWQVSAYNPAS